MGGDPVNFVDVSGEQSSCGPGHFYCRFPELIGEVSKASLKNAFKNSELIRKGKGIRKVNQLCEKYGGKPKDWMKRKGWDERGREFHWYEKNGKKYLVKPQGRPDLGP